METLTRILAMQANDNVYKDHYQTLGTVFSRSDKPLKELCTYTMKGAFVNPEELNRACRFKQNAL